MFNTVVGGTSPFDNSNVIHVQQNLVPNGHIWSHLYPFVLFCPSGDGAPIFYFLRKNRKLAVMAELKKKPVFARRIFWDVNFDALDYDAKASFIIERVFERGDVEDIRQCRRYYGDEKIRDVLVNAKWLSLQTIYLACALFDNQLTDYKCYNTALSNPEHCLY